MKLTEDQQRTTYISLKNKFILSTVPKCGSSMVRNLMNNLEMKTSPCYFNNIKDKEINPNELFHSQYLTYWNLGPEMFGDIVKRDDFKKFILVRNPYDRFVSFYRNRFLEKGNKPVGRKEYVDPVAKYLNTNQGRHSEVSIDQFAEAVKEIGFYNYHLLPVKHHVVPIKYDKVMKLENIKEDIECLSFCYPLEELRKVISNKVNPSSGPSPKLSSKSREIVYNLYKEDFINYNYEN